MTTREKDVGNALRDMGRLALRLFGQDTERNLRELDMAIEAAGRLTECAKESLELEKAAWNTLPGSREWQLFFSAHRRYLSCLRQYRKNSRRFGWSPLSRRLLWKKYIRLWKNEDMDEACDPMEALLKEYGVPSFDGNGEAARKRDERNREREAARKREESDREMEALLSGEWNVEFDDRE